MKKKINKFKVGDIVKIKPTAYKILEMYRGKYYIIIDYFNINQYDYKIMPLFKDNSKGIPVFSNELESYK